ncbi:rhodanese-like domain-containing protein [Pseudooctadecabacter jejudonensis]|uniref:Molybdopterin biosynthesis-like protein MoeZ n=1 Tax=Pseudooctadecabacter jejudonensis TaxID=1391910 RepID=A0A1Y5SS94_9RHOB|nr:rhodanese-like domain-containing protein [Pseudooctadecabacter jejudonensis]SLN44100.1 molybdopterin biosynthesis-like protein MoeZ [Pseudooctadecabacter jejudonensis]
MALSWTRRHLVFGGAAAALLATGAVVSSGFAQSSDGPTLNPVEAHAAAGAGEILLVDIRRPDEWNATGIGEHAVGIDMRDEDFIDQVLAARQADQPIALICARGVRSARMTARLKDAGIGPIIDVPEGMLGSFSGPGWVGRGVPVVR